MAAPADYPPPAPPETTSPSPDHAPSSPSSSPQPPPTTEPAPETLAAPAVAAGPDCRSFSQLLAGAMASPTGTSRPVAPIFAVPVDAAGLPMVAVPCFLAPATLLDSPTFTGQFAMTHQAVLATVTAQAQMQLQVAQPVVSAISPVPLQQMPPSLHEESVCTPRVEKTQPQSVQIASKVNPDDGFNWRKYGQKQVKSSENSRSYYKCTSANCSAKKKVTRCPDGRVTEVMYRGQHGHDPPQQTRYWRERVVRSSPLGENEMLVPPSVESNDSDPSTSKTEQNSGNETPEQQLFCSSDCEGDAAVKTEEDLGEERDPKRRLSESTVLPYSSPVLKTFREPRIVVQAASDVGRVSDGYRWRKYGQKIVKGNPNPRSYYRCTHNGCPVRKHVERASDDVKSIVISYEGTHNHDLPGPKNSTDPPASPPLPSATASHSSHSKLDQKLSLPDEKALNIGGEKALESVQALLSIGCNPTASDGDKGLESRNPNPPLRVENPAAVPVQNS